MLQKKQKGFTLVEIAIVLVIVGLLIGGVLKGQEMITNAKLKRIESDNAGLAAAIFSYQDRYLQLPGDDTEADTRFDNFDASGDGNGSIEGNWWVSPDGGGEVETGKFWMMLRASGLVSGDPTDFMGQQNAYGGRIGVSSGALGIGGHVTVFGQLEGSVVKIVESRLDDGVPGTGRVRSRIASIVTFAPVVNSDTGESTGGGAADAATAYTDLALYDTVFRF
jgi:prepilin-type N-terminal cleavage/methylation domain-containing protein